MDDEEKKLTNILESISLDQARQKLANGDFGSSIGRNYVFVSSWISRKEVALREAREAEILSISRKALWTSYAAIIIAIIAILFPIIIAFCTKK